MGLKTLVCRLRFPSGLRVGGLSGDPDRVESVVTASTLWGGVGCCAAHLAPKEEVSALIRGGRLSSLLWVREDRWFVPCPRIPWKGIHPEARKSLKKWAWVPLEDLSGVLAGEVPPGEPPRLFREDRQMAVTLDRKTCASLPYARRRLLPEPGVEGVLVAQVPREGEALFRGALRLLGDTGLGGDRSQGWGHFSSTIQDADRTPFASPLEGVGAAYLALGAWLPDEGEVRALEERLEQGSDLVGYDLWRLRGFAGEAEDRLKPTVCCLGHGTLVPFRPQGRVVDLPLPGGPPVVFNGCPPFLAISGSPRR